MSWLVLLVGAALVWCGAGGRGPHRIGSISSSGPSAAAAGVPARGLLRGLGRGDGDARGGHPQGTAHRVPTPARLELVGAMLDAGTSMPAALAELARVEASPALEAVALRLGLGLPWTASWEAAEAALGRHPEGRNRLQKRGPRRLSRAHPFRDLPRTAPSAAAERRGLRQLRDDLAFAADTGAPAAALLRAQATRIRRQEHREAEKRAAALGVRLVVPLGLCSLPSFVCLGVLPVLIGLVPALW